MRFVLRHAAGSAGTQALSLALLADGTNLARRTFDCRRNSEPSHVTFSPSGGDHGQMRRRRVGQGLGRRVGVEGWGWRGGEEMPRTRSDVFDVYFPRFAGSEAVFTVCLAVCLLHSRGVQTHCASASSADGIHETSSCRIPCQLALPGSLLGMTWRQAALPPSRIRRVHP